MKKIFILLALFAVTASVNAQVKVHPSNLVTINAQTQDWWPALRITVPTQNSCAYNLWNTYHNKDVFYVCGDGYLWALKGGYFGSDIALKKNITPIERVLKKVIGLQGVRYQYKDDNENGEENQEKFRLGFIAQDVETVFPEMIKDMPDGTKAMSYTDLIAVLVEAIKEQQKEIETVQSVVFLQEKELVELKEIISQCCVKPKSSYTPSSEEPQQSAEDKATLYQNTPNPFTSNTEILCNIPEINSNAFIFVYNLQGVELKSFSLTQGLNTVTVYGSELTAGMYLYTLVVDNEIIDTKRMILTK